jgi:uncharacterized protein YciI
MQFLILGYDAGDADAMNRRMAAREAHIATIARYKALGHMILGAALLDAGGRMNGSVIVAEFPDRAALDEWLTQDPYVTGKVWERVEVTECKLAPSFVSLIPKAA